MFAENLYSKLGTPPEAKIALQFTHKGLEGRTLTSASPNRSVFPRTSAETTSSSEVRTTLGAMKGTRMDDVRKVLEPMFMLFDFMEFQKEVYEDIVGTFERGQVR
jgi:hypothetical protein